MGNTVESNLTLGCAALTMLIDSTSMLVELLKLTAIAKGSDQLRHFETLAILAAQQGVGGFRVRADESFCFGIER